MRWAILPAMAALVLGAGGAAAAAPNTPVVSGTVLSEAGAPLSHTQVVVLPLGRTTLTDATGRFVFHNLPAGRYRLEFTRIGYAPANQQVVLPVMGEALRLEVRLTPSPLSLPGVQVTGTPLGSGALETAQGITQLHGRALERSLSGTLAQTLEAQPGMAVRYNGPGAAAPVVRGLTGDRVLLLQDGQRTADLSGSADDHPVTIDPLAAQRVEVVRGPASLLYGNNALGGVINVISHDIPTSAAQGAEGAAAVQTESAYPGGSGSGRLVLPLGGGLALSARGGGRSTGDVRVGQAPGEQARLANTGFRASHGALGLGYSGRSATGGAALRVYAFDYGLPAPDEELVTLRGRRYEAVARVEAPLGAAGGGSLRIDASLQDYHHDELDPGGAVEMAFGLRTQTLSLLLRQGALGPLSEGAWGTTGLFRQYTATGHEQLTPPAIARGLGIFGFQQLPLGSGALQFGARLDHQHVASRDDARFGPGRTAGFTAVSGSLGLSMPLADAVTAGVNVARSFRAPTVEELFSGAYHAGTAAFEVGDRSLGPEVGNGAEALLRIRHPRLNAEVAVHGRGFADFIFLEPRGDTLIGGERLPLLAYTAADARLHGVEASAEVAVRHDLVLTFGGDAIRARRADGTPLPFMPPARLTTGVRWDDGRFSVGGGARHAFAQRRVGSADEATTDAYTLLDADLGFRFRRARAVHSLTLRGTNLADVLYRDAASRIKDFAPNPGRNLALMYRLMF